MSVLEQARKAVLGETWALPIAVSLLVGLAVAFKQAAPGAWADLGGAFLLIGAVAVLVALVERARPG